MEQVENICTITELIKKQGSSTVLGPLSLCLKKGEILGIRGANGAGKSTLIKIIAGILKADGGRIAIAPQDKKAIGYIPQEIALYPSLSGRHNLAFWADIYGLRGRDKKKRIQELLAEVNLLDQADVLVQAYSGGMMRRLNLACALLGNPRLLLLDEPTVGADLQSVEIMLTIMKNMKEKGSSVVFISHRDDELAKVSDRIITIDQGKIVS